MAHKRTTSSLAFASNDMAVGAESNAAQANPLSTLQQAIKDGTVKLPDAIDVGKWRADLRDDA